ncbi:MAG: ATP-binding cassette domain-containing protein [Deferribacteraceae bacterium]|jgi:cell division transport system ATP-binding protein|nr:ATP-binding cassette domain-containing protein [Deferribacteraceae bacterium]
MINFERVGVIFPGNCHALRDVSLNVARGEFVYVLGRSGAGKSTLLRLIYADFMPTCGVVRIAGNDITFLPRCRIPYLRRQIGIIFQDYKLLNEKNVFDNVRMALDIYFFRKSMARERIWPLLKQLGLFELRDVEVKRLSGGEKQRVAIARALVNDPQIILADEPTGNLDSANAAAIMELLLRAQVKGAAVLMVTHDLNMPEKFPARAVHLDAGRLENA